MKKAIIYMGVILTTAVACVYTQKDHGVSADIKPCFCADSLQKEKLCNALPLDVNEKFGFGYTSVLDSNFQPPFDEFSWQTFIALNWPSGGTEPIEGGLNANKTATRVWEKYDDPAALFAEGAKKTLFLQVNALSKEGKKVLYLTAKSGHGAGVSLKGFEEADGRPLIDRNLNFTLYEEKVNPDEAAFIRKNKLWFNKNIDSLNMLNGGFTLPASAAPKTIGAMEIKASWRILDPSKGDDTTRFYTRKAIILIPAAQSVTGNELQIEATVGLVGMHIIHKTAVFGKMAWSTFEQIDNVPDNPQDAQNTHSKRWSYYNPACLNCPVNEYADTLKGDGGFYKWNATAPYAKRYAKSVDGEAGGQVFGSQITRVYPVYFRTEQMNKIWQAKLKGTVWSNYRLIGSQWSAGGENIKVANVPAMLANVTLESFMQNKASCISCHSNAHIEYNKKKINTDFSFLFGLAK